MNHSEGDKKDVLVERFYPEYLTGLTSKQVERRNSEGLYNEQLSQVTRPVSKIIKSNVFTLFNLLNIFLATIILIMGDWKNALFIGVAVANTVIGIYQELRAKKTLDELSFMAQEKAKVIRDSKMHVLRIEELVLDDVILLEEGNQIPADSVVLSTDGMGIDESLLTGEPNQIRKMQGDSVMSGSFVTSGTAYVRINAVGKENYAAKLSIEAKQERRKPSKLMRTLNNIIRVLTIVIIPVGALLFYSNYSGGTDIKTSVLGATAAMLGMIPEGLILLTSVTFAVGSINLAKRKTLVQTLPSIETLARADVLCLDKTGTITDGHLTMEEILPVIDYPIESCEVILSQIMHTSTDKNPTATAIREKYNKHSGWKANKIVAFSSERKWSGASYDDMGSYIMGAPEFIFDEIPSDIQNKIDKYSKSGLRVMALAYSKNMLKDTVLPDGLQFVAILVLSDNIRPNAIETFKYFADEGVDIKVISGDNAVTVSQIALQAKISGAENYIDMSKVDDDSDFGKIAEHNTVFGRVTPYQKQKLVKAMKDNGKTVCMTGDGVNDVLALKEADCGVAMVGGSEAARGVADFVLLDPDFSAMVEVLKEGRRVINNIENVASLYLVKTIYSTVLAVLFIYLPFAYPFSPLQMSPINTLTVGIPSFFLALEANYSRPKGRFIANVLENSVPAAITVIFNIIVIQLAGVAFDLPHADTATMAVLLTGTVGFILLFKVSLPLNWKKRTMIITLLVAFFGMFIIMRNFFEFSSLFTRNVFFYLPLMVSSIRMFSFINRAVVVLEDKYFIWREKRKSKKALSIK